MLWENHNIINWIEINFIEWIALSAIHLLNTQGKVNMVGSIQGGLYPWWEKIHSIVLTLMESGGWIQNFGKIVDGNHRDVMIIYMYCFLQTLKMLKLKMN